MRVKTWLYPCLTILVAVSIAAFLLVSGCGHGSTGGSNTEVTTASGVDIDYVAGYVLTIGDLAGDADLIVLGTVTGTVEVVPHETLAQVWQTKSAFNVEKSYKGDYEDEIIIIQTGAVGKGENPGNPVFESGEQCFLFLTKGTDGIYRLVDPQGRLRIEDGMVSSMNYLYPTEESRPPDELKFRKADLDIFLSQVMDAIKSDHPVPDEEPVIVMDLLRIMGGSHEELSIYKDGTVVCIREWRLRHPMPDYPPMRAWRFGKIDAEDVTDLLEFFRSSGFNNLYTDSRAVEPNAGSGVMSDLMITISQRNGRYNKTVTTSGYAPPEQDTMAKKLQPPLDEIYTKLKTIGDEETEEAYREEIKTDTNITYEYPEENK
jgi:hypothetical protein